MTCLCERPVSFGPSPPQKIFVESTIDSRRHPVCLRMRPIERSASPFAYTSAPSKKFTPRS